MFTFIKNTEIDSLPQVFLPFVFDVVSQIETKMLKVGSGWQCSDCEYSSAKKYNLYRHVEVKHVEA